MESINISEQKIPFMTRLLEVLGFVFTALFFIADLALNFHFHYFSMRTKAVCSLAVEMCCIVVCGMLYFSALIDKRRSQFRKLFLELVFFEALAFFLDSIYWYIAKNPQYNTLLIIENFLLYLCDGIIFIIFWGCEVNIMNLTNVISEKVLSPVRALMIFYIVAVILNLKFGFFYTIKDGVFINNPVTGWTEKILPYTICFILLFYAIRIKVPLKIRIPFILMAVLPIIAMSLQHVMYLSWFVYAAILLATFVLYINIHVSLNHEIDEFRNKVMISQIQPHFMYNTLTTIKALCRVDPDLAANTITNFADYLRGNMDFASLETTIPLEKELKHTKIYTEIEALRFDNITFEFKIEDEGFEVPALVIQPMVENAVRHGVRSRKDGHILIHTYGEDKYHVIVIQDNGKGFDNAQFNGSRTHIGLLNTRLRIERLVNGKFEVESVPEKGVTITMRIPK